MGLLPTAQAAPDTIKLPGRMFITAFIDESGIVGKPKKEPQLLQKNLRAPQKRRAIPIVSRLNNQHEQI